MRKTTLAILVVFALAVVAWAGGDPWKKPLAEWTDKDITAILQTSPWAKAGVQAQGAWRPDGVTQASGAGGVAGSGSDRTNASAGATPDKAGGVEKNAAAAAASATYSV